MMDWEPLESEIPRVSCKSNGTLYARLGGYDAIAALADDLLRRLKADKQLGRFWEHRGDDGMRREEQLLIDFLCSCSGGPVHYGGRDMVTTHKGMRISQEDWRIFIGHLNDAFGKFEVPVQETSEVSAFVESLKSEIVEV
jgi:hemoglobin